MSRCFRYEVLHFAECADRLLVWFSSLGLVLDYLPILLIIHLLGKDFIVLLSKGMIDLRQLVNNMVLCLYLRKRGGIVFQIYGMG